jgi:hypothetical protein
VLLSDHLLSKSHCPTDRVVASPLESKRSVFGFIMDVALHLGLLADVVTLKETSPRRKHEYLPETSHKTWTNFWRQDHCRHLPHGRPSEFLQWPVFCRMATILA